MSRFHFDAFHDILLKDAIKTIIIYDGIGLKILINMRIKVLC